MVVHQPVFAALWATVYVLMSVCWPAWRVRGAVWRSVRASLVIEWRGECAGMGPWEREEGIFFFDQRSLFIAHARPDQGKKYHFHQHPRRSAVTTAAGVHQMSWSDLWTTHNQTVIGLWAVYLNASGSTRTV